MININNQLKLRKVPFFNKAESDIHNSRITLVKILKRSRYEYVNYILFPSLDLCLNYTAEDRWQRSNQSIFDPMSMSPLCDISLRTNWYRFTSKAGGLIPPSCPPLNSCGMFSHVFQFSWHYYNCFLSLTKGS